MSEHHHGEKVRVTCDPAGNRVRPEFRDAADVNQIVSRYRVTGFLPQVPVKPIYGDFSSVGDYQQALAKVARAEAAFMALPSWLRSKCGNDPERFLAWALDPANAAELVKLGVEPGEASDVAKPAAGATQPAGGETSEPPGQGG